MSSLYLKDYFINRVIVQSVTVFPHSRYNPGSVVPTCHSKDFTVGISCTLFSNLHLESSAIWLHRNTMTVSKHGPWGQFQFVTHIPTHCMHLFGAHLWMMMMMLWVWFILIWFMIFGLCSWSENHQDSLWDDRLWQKIILWSEQFKSLFYCLSFFKTRCLECEFVFSLSLSPSLSLSLCLSFLLSFVIDLAKD
jgi:hypothetical protein